MKTIQIDYRILACLCGFMVMSAPAIAADPIALTRFGTHSEEGLADAVLVTNADSVQTTQLLPANDARESAEKQVQSVLDQLGQILTAFDAPRSSVVKLNYYLSDPDVRTIVTSESAAWLEDGNEPAVSFVTSNLPGNGVLIALDAVFALQLAEGGAPLLRHMEPLGGEVRLAHAAILPRGDVIYVAGQAEEGDLPMATRATLEGLLRTLTHLGLDRDHIVGLKCFLQPMSAVDTVNEQIAGFFGEAIVPPVSHVEWISSEKQPIEIELIARAPAEESTETVTYLTLPWMTTSPVYSRAVRLHGDRRLYISGLYAEEPGDGERQVRSIFTQLERILEASGSDLRHLVKATYYVSDEDASTQLNQLRPLYYDPARPPAASKAMVRGVAHPERSITIDMVAAPSK